MPAPTLLNKTILLTRFLALALSMFIFTTLPAHAAEVPFQQLAAVKVSLISLMTLISEWASPFPSRPPLSRGSAAL